MMRKKQISLTLIAIFLLSVPILHAQQSYLYNKDVAVFYPANFHADETLPSAAIVKELVPQASLPVDWKDVPTFDLESGRNTVTLNVAPGTDLYGTGEVLGDLKRNGTNVSLWATDNYMYQAHDGKQLYQAHPWVLGVRADGSSFGVIADNSWKSTIDLKNGIHFISEGPMPRVIVIEKNSPDEVMKELANLTGTMQLPPLWALGYQQCRYSYNPDSRVKEIADGFRNHHIPCDVIWMDIDYMNAFRVFTFDPKQFPDPKGLNDYLHQKHFKSVYMIDPGIKKDESYFVYNQGTKGDYWVKDKDGLTFVGEVWPGDCVFPDFTRPEVRGWWSTLYKDFMAKGVDGVWNDMNEPAVFKGVDASMPPTNVHKGGDGWPSGTHLRYHNLFGMNMVKATREGIMEANPSKRPFVLSRSNFLGGQRYAATWTGDNSSSWQHLLASIPMSLNLSLSGQPFNGPDMGGFALDCNADLLSYWTASGVFFPFARNHAAKGTVNQEPWAFGEKTENVCRTAIERRYRFLPYIYTLFQEATTDGMPIMRPVFMSDVKDTTLRSEQESFMLGGDLLIIPRWSKSLRLPKGDWDILKLEDNDDGYQPFVALRPGAIVPMTKAIESTADFKTDSITLLVNPDADGKAFGRLYDDAGEGYDYQKGDYSICEFSAMPTKDGELMINVSKVAGYRDVTRYYRIGYVTDNKILYSDWSNEDTLFSKVVDDKQNGIDKSKLKMANIDFAKLPSLKQQMQDNFKKMNIKEAKF